MLTELLRQQVVLRFENVHLLGNRSPPSGWSDAKITVRRLFQNLVAHRQGFFHCGLVKRLRQGLHIGLTGCLTVKFVKIFLACDVADQLRQGLGTERFVGGQGCIDGCTFTTRELFVTDQIGISANTLCEIHGGRVSHCSVNGVDEAADPAGVPLNSSTTGQS